MLTTSAPAAFIAFARAAIARLCEAVILVTRSASLIVVIPSCFCPATGKRLPPTGAVCRYSCCHQGPLSCARLLIYGHTHALRALICSSRTLIVCRSRHPTHNIAAPSSCSSWRCNALNAAKLLKKLQICKFFLLLLTHRLI